MACVGTDLRGGYSFESLYDFACSIGCSKAPPKCAQAPLH